MNTVEVSTDVRVPPEEAYAFVADFPRYAEYSEYLESVTQHGEGGPGTEYELTFSWWKLSHTVRSRVTDTEEPERIDWTLVSSIDAHGRWEVTETDGGSRVTLVVTYDKGSAKGALELPALVSMDMVVDKVADKVIEEGEHVVERVVADLEGERRPVELRVETR